MSTSSPLQDELFKWKEALAHSLIDARYTANIRNLDIRAICDHYALEQFIGDHSGKAVDKSVTGVKPCK